MIPPVSGQRGWPLHIWETAGQLLGSQLVLQRVEGAIAAVLVSIAEAEAVVKKKVNNVIYHLAHRHRPTPNGSGTGAGVSRLA